MASDRKIPPAPRWDIDSVFPGGSASPQFKAFRDKVKADLDAAAIMMDRLPDQLNASTLAQWTDTVLKLQSIIEDIKLIRSMSECLVCQNVTDAAASAVQAEGDVLVSSYEKLQTHLEAKSLAQGDAEWKLLTGHPSLAPIAFFLDELRAIARSKMPLEMERLALDLSVSGLHAWDRLYNKMAGDLRVRFDEAGATTELSLGQLAAKMADTNRAVRKQAFEKLVAVWETRQDLAAMTLNALEGFRMTLFDHRKWDWPLHEPLVFNRMQRQSLDTMWQVVRELTPRLKPYVEAKKKLLGIDKFTWYDEFAPCGKADRMIPFDEAGRFVINCARSFSDDMADFMTMALENRWVEGEDRPGKAGGAWCTGMGSLRKPRVFMTYTGTFDNLMTLGHELGHAYHQWVLRKTPGYATQYPMGLAETASIFAETLVLDAALKQSTDPQEKLMLLEQKLQQAYVLFTDLQCRYLFELDFCAERRKGVVPTQRLKDMMISAQKRAYGELLDESGHHPLFWASKLHFYIGEFGFYNFPYTVGFLFAGGVYDRAKKEGKAFAPKYAQLLADTGGMRTEDVARKHLGVDLTQKQFWTDAVTRSMADLDEFVRLADELA